MSENLPHGGRPADVVIVGSFVLDHVWQTDRFPLPGETRRALGFSTGPGGKGFNQAVACRRQGCNPLFLGALGRDAIGEHAQSLAHDEGLTCQWQQVEAVPTATAGIIVDADGANEIMVNLAANEHLTADFVHSHDAHFAGARIVLVQLENGLDAIRAALDRGRQHSALCVLNPAPMHAGVDADLLSRCDVITPNETEFALLLRQIIGQTLQPDEVATLEDARLHALCRCLGVDTIVVTLGAAGCFVSHRVERTRGDDLDHYRIAAERVRAIDSTGAGDAFSGALVAALARSPDQPFEHAVRQAGRVAALSTERSGAARSIPDAREVHARFNP